MNAVTLSQYAESVPIECSVERAALSASVIRVFCVGVVVMKRARQPRCCWREVEEGERARRRMRCYGSVHPGHRDPLTGGAHQVNGLLQVPDGLINLIVDDGLVEIVCVGLLQDLRLFLQPLE